MNKADPEAYPLLVLAGRCVAMVLAVFSISVFLITGLISSIVVLAYWHVPKPIEIIGGLFLLVGCTVSLLSPVTFVIPSYCLWRGDWRCFSKRGTQIVYGLSVLLNLTIAGIFSVCRP